MGGCDCGDTRLVQLVAQARRRRRTYREALGAVAVAEVQQHAQPALDAIPGFDSGAIGRRSLPGKDSVCVRPEFISSEVLEHGKFFVESVEDWLAPHLLRQQMTEAPVQGLGFWHEHQVSYTAA